MATMLLNAFARYEGLSYLGHSLAKPLQDVTMYIDNCEIDPQKLGPDRSTIKRDENEANLRNACLIFIRSVIEGRDMMPPSIRRMCYFLYVLVEDIHKDLAANPPDRLMTGEDRNQILGSSLPDRSILGSSLPRPMNMKTSFNDYEFQPSSRKTQQNDDAASVSSKSSRKSESHDDNGILKIFSRKKKGQGTISASGQNSERNSTAALRSDSTKSAPIQRSTSQVSTHSAFHPEPHGKKDTMSPRSSEYHYSSPLGKKSNDELRYGSPDVQTPSGSYKSSGLMDGNLGSSFRPSGFAADLRLKTSTARYSISSMASLPSANGSPRSMGTLTVAEKVVGSFLFLRFFVPAITAPDNYGLVDKKVSYAGRRGLILVGKVLTALCNDVEFGAKEQYLVPLNGFLREHRHSLKEFLRFAASEDVADPPDGSPEDTSETSSVQGTHDGSVRMNPLADHIRSNALSASMPSLKEQAMVRKPKLVARSCSTEFDGTDNLFLYLGKALYKIEKDLEERINHMSAAESEGVLTNFYELKKLIESSPYCDNPEAHKKPTPLLTKLSKKRILGLFQGKEKSTSYDDISGKKSGNSLSISRS
ncbi:Ras GTPase activating protein ira2 [Quaeritorhiza haematococci]|nr:Ras GTPase activating protein ira2 [Quaeritorhiza haematococci]